MRLRGTAAVAMWWDIAPDRRAEFEDWHTHEHFPERLGLPGFRRGSRWTSLDTAKGYFVLYELQRYETLTSAAYVDRLNAPTPWSRKMMPHHLRMVRSQCRVAFSVGGAMGAVAMTARFRPSDGAAPSLVDVLRARCGELAGRPGVTGAALLHTETPAMAVTTEQAIRGGPDPTADWILIVDGHDRTALDAARDAVFGDVASGRLLDGPPIAGVYALSCVGTPEDYPAVDRGA